MAVAKKTKSETKYCHIKVCCLRGVKFTVTAARFHWTDKKIKTKESNTFSSAMDYTEIILHMYIVHPMREEEK